ncbi:MAG TPA: hypothetical protein VNO32_06895, partial [Candidatus Acidoferrum sp.]|nr:hypothetical protein [Candidatus Acidoferrum sp.]
MGKIFGKCANCATLIVGGPKEGDLRFCSEECHHFYLHPKFCDVCLAETTEGNIGGTFTLNALFGTRLMGFGVHCPTCYSVVKRAWLWFVIPLVPVSARYRVLYQTPRRYGSRKLNEVGLDPKAFVKPVLALAAVALVLILARVSFLEKNRGREEPVRPLGMASAPPAPHTTAQKSAIQPCDRPSPLETKEQLLRLHSAFDGYIAEE